MQNWFLPPCSKQASRALTLQWFGFSHIRDGSFGHQSPAKGYPVSSTCVHCSPAPSSDVWCILHHMWLCSRCYTARSKKLWSLEKLQRRRLNSNQWTEQSPYIFGSSRPQAVTAWQFCWKQPGVSEVTKICHISNWDTEHRPPGRTEMEQTHCLPSPIWLMMPCLYST